MTGLHRPLEQRHSITHIVGSAHSDAGRARGLLQQVHDVSWIPSLPPYTIHAPALRGEFTLYSVRGGRQVLEAPAARAAKMYSTAPKTMGNLQ